MPGLARLIKCAGNSLRNASVGLVFCRTELLDTGLCISCAKPRSVSLHPPVHVVLPTADNLQFHGLHGFRHILLECIKCVITIFPKISFHNTPKELNKIEFTMKLWQKNAKMASSLDDFLNERFLLLEVGLVFKDLFIATIGFFQVAFAGTLSLEIPLIEATFSEDCFEPFWLIWVFSMICGEFHGLNNFLPILKVPAVMHVSLFPARSHIHMQDNQCILRISSMTLRVIHHDQCLVTCTMSSLKCWNNFLPKLKDKLSAKKIAPMQYY